MIDRLHKGFIVAAVAWILAFLWFCISICTRFDDLGYASIWLSSSGHYSFWHHFFIISVGFVLPIGFMYGIVWALKTKRIDGIHRVFIIVTAVLALAILVFLFHSHPFNDIGYTVFRALLCWIIPTGFMYSIVWAINGSHKKNNKSKEQIPIIGRDDMDKNGKGQIMARGLDW